MKKNGSGSFLAHGLFESGMHRWLLRDTAIVVLFHRVDPTIGPGPITCTPEEFRRYCDFFARYFDVVPLSDLVDRLRSGKALTGKLAITFDDGYRDNWSHARPILRDAGLPATFFVATGYLGTDRIAPWDRDLGPSPDWMTWNQIEGLKEEGFEIGAHTVDHVDLGGISGSCARHEIRECGIQLERRLGEWPQLFSYPFGRPTNIAQANRKRINQAGYRSCFSAFGGTVTPSTSPFRIPRVPVSDWYAGPYHLGMSLLKERVAEIAE